MIALLAALMAIGISVTIPPQAHAAAYSGTVFCTGGTIEGNSAVVGIWIAQPRGRSGWANFSRIDNWTASWSFDFENDEPYQIRVGCGGKPERWQTTNVGTYVKPSLSSHDYICDVGRGFCIAS